MSQSIQERKRLMEGWKLLSRKCDVYGNLHGIFDDGRGLQQTELLVKNHPPCQTGVTGRPLMDAVLAANTLVSSRCNNEDLIGTYADGYGNFSDRIVEVNSPQCGFDPAANLLRRASGEMTKHNTVPLRVDSRLMPPDLPDFDSL